MEQLLTLCPHILPFCLCSCMVYGLNDVYGTSIISLYILWLICSQCHLVVLLLALVGCSDQHLADAVVTGGVAVG